MTVELIETSPETPDALELIGELSSRLRDITGDSGAKNFSKESVRSDNARFVVAYRDGHPCGCGAFRPLDPATFPGVCEIKRMYARIPGVGIGSLILKDLEQHAAAMGYREAWLETRRVNTVAVSFYKGHGYTERENYGVYVGWAEAVCFEKRFS
jgi:GNAT superfamily N-acetyltransferase